MAVVWPSKNNFANGDVLTATNMNNIGDTLNVFNPTSATSGQVWTANGSGSGSYASIASATKIMKPTSVSVGSGTATINTDGSVTLTNVTVPISFNGVFDATCRNYMILINTVTETGGNLTFRWRAAGVDNSGTYQWQTISVANTTFTGARTTANSTGIVTVLSGGGAGNGHFNSIQGWVWAPFVSTEKTTSRFFSVNETTNVTVYDYTTFCADAATSYDGFTLLSTTPRTASVTVYGFDI